MRAAVFAFAESLRSSLWFPPLVALILAAIGGLGLLYVDQDVAVPWLGSIALSDPDAARDVLSVVATTMLTLTALVFTITMVVLQLASAQYSPRVTRSFLRDGQTKLTLSVFLGTFAYSLVVLQGVRSADGGFVPSAAIAMTYVLVAISLVLFALYLNHIAQSIRPSAIIQRMASEAAAVIERLGPPLPALDPGAMGRELPVGRTVHSVEDAGVLTYIDENALADAAGRMKRVLRVVLVVGDFIPRGTPLLEILGNPPEVNEEEIRRAFKLNADRTPIQDLGLGFRDLTDIAIRALSPGVNDPTTAVQALDRIHDLLRSIVSHPLRPRYVSDEQGNLRVLLARMSWDELLRLAVTEIRQYGKHSVQVMRRLVYLLDDLSSVAPVDRRQSILVERKLVFDSIERAFDIPEDRIMASCPDAQGLGLPRASSEALRGCREREVG